MDKKPNLETLLDAHHQLIDFQTDRELGKTKTESPALRLSDNQKRFVNSARRAGHTVDYGYSGRGMYGRTCPAVRLRRGDEWRPGRGVQFQTDGMGLGTVVYARE